MERDEIEEVIGEVFTAFKRCGVAFPESMLESVRCDVIDAFSNPDLDSLSNVEARDGGPVDV